MHLRSADVLVSLLCLAFTIADVLAICRCQTALRSNYYIISSLITRTQFIICWYGQVCEYIKAGGVEVWDDLQRVPYVYLGDQWVGYDNPDSIKDKVLSLTPLSLSVVLVVLVCGWVMCTSVCVCVCA